MSEWDWEKETNADILSPLPILNETPKSHQASKYMYADISGWVCVKCQTMIQHGCEVFDGEQPKSLKKMVSNNRNENNWPDQSKGRRHRVVGRWWSVFRSNYLCANAMHLQNHVKSSVAARSLCPARSHAHNRIWICSSNKQEKVLKTVCTHRFPSDKSLKSHISQFQMIT